MRRRPPLKLSLMAPTQVTITRNNISGNPNGIVYSTTQPFNPPVLTGANATGVEGTCSVAGLVEVFSDPSDQGETFLGEVPCDAANPWHLTVPVPEGRNVTTTLTSSAQTSLFFSDLAARRRRRSGGDRMVTAASLSVKTVLADVAVDASYVSFVEANDTTGATAEWAVKRAPRTGSGAVDTLQALTSGARGRSTAARSSPVRPTGCSRYRSRAVLPGSPVFISRRR